MLNTGKATDDEDEKIADFQQFLLFAKFQQILLLPPGCFIHLGWFIIISLMVNSPLVEPWSVAVEAFQLEERLTTIKGQAHSHSDYDDDDDDDDDGNDEDDDDNASCENKRNHGGVGVLKGFVGLHHT